MRDQVQGHNHDLKGKESFSAASILEVLSADLDCGARVVIEAVGPDEQEALDDLEALLLRFRDEEGGAQETGLVNDTLTWEIDRVTRRDCERRSV